MWPIYAKIQAQLGQKEIKANAPWIEVVKKQNGTLVDTGYDANDQCNIRRRSLCITCMSGWLG